MFAFSSAVRRHFAGFTGILLAGIFVAVAMPACGGSSEGTPNASEAPTAEPAAPTDAEEGAPLVCPDGFGDCDGDPENGCEVELATDAAHCGGCGQVCNWTCGNGVCNDPIQLSLHIHLSCATLGTGEAACWGRNEHGQVGNGSGATTDAKELSPKYVRVSGTERLTNVKKVSAGQRHACALLHDGTVYCWGDNADGQLGDGTLVSRTFAAPVRAPAEGFFSGPALTNVVDLEVGWVHTCAVVESGRVYCWGSQRYGRLGQGQAVDDLVAPSPVVGMEPADPVFGSAMGVSAGAEVTCIRRQNDALCTGHDYFGAVGDGDHVEPYVYRPTPLLGVDGLDRWESPITEISLQRHAGCALQENGHVACWGHAPLGGVGDNIARGQAEPVLDETGLGLLSGITQISGTDWHVCSLTDSGTAYCWGWNSHRQLGNLEALPESNPWAPAGNTLLPVAVLDPETAAPMGGIAEIRAGGQHTCARLVDGRVKCWGQSAFGALGHGEASDALDAVEVLPPTD